MSYLEKFKETEWSEHTKTRFNKFGLDLSCFVLYFLFKNVVPVVEGIDQVKEYKNDRLLYCIAPHASWVDVAMVPYVLIKNKIKYPRSVARSNSDHKFWGYIQREWYKSFFIDDKLVKQKEYLEFSSTELTAAARQDDMILYFQGGRSYTGRFQKPKRMSFNSFVDPSLKDAFIVPVTLTYDLVLEDEILVNIWKKDKQKTFPEELREIKKYPEGPVWQYRSKVYIYFGRPLPVSSYIGNRSGQRMALPELMNELNLNRRITETAIFSAAVVDGFVTNDPDARPRTFITFMYRDQLEHKIEKYLTLVKDKNMLVSEDPKQIIEIAAFYFGLRGRVKLSKQGAFIDNSHKTFNYYANSIEDLLANEKQNSDIIRL